MTQDGQTDPTPVGARASEPRWWAAGNEHSKAVGLFERCGGELRPVAVMSAKDAAQRVRDADAIQMALNAHDQLVAALEAVEYTDYHAGRSNDGEWVCWHAVPLEVIEQVRAALAEATAPP